MSLNFSIDSILRHGNVEQSSNPTLLGPNKLNQSDFINESTNTFLKKQGITSYLSNNLASPETLNGTTEVNGLLNPFLNETVIANNSLIQSPLLYLNKTVPSTGCSTNNTSSSALNLMDATSLMNGTTSTTFPFELNQLGQLTHLNSIELSRLTQFQNQLNQFQNQLYLSKINSFYNNSSAPTLNEENSNLNSNGKPNSNHHHHQPLNNHNQQNGAARAALFNTGSFSNHKTESQCSPLSDKSCEMLLNYEDSSDSNRMSQHSGNNISINSNNSTSASSNQNRGQSSSSNNNSFNNKDPPLCTKCKLHGIRNYVKGHKKNCPKRDCMCQLCILTDYGKRLRGKKSKKQPGSSLSSVASANLLMMESLNNELNSNLSNFKNFNSNINGKLMNDTKNSLQQIVHNQSTTPNSNSSSSSGSTISISTALAVAASLRGQQQQISSSLINPTLNKEPTASSFSPNLTLAEKNTIQNLIKIVISILKNKLAQDGLNYDQELYKLKCTVIYILSHRFNKKDLLNRFSGMCHFYSFINFLNLFRRFIYDSYRMPFKFASEEYITTCWLKIVQTFDESTQL